MSYANYQQTNGFINGPMNPNSENDNTMIRETAGSNESAVNVPSGTGAVRRSNQGYYKGKKDKSSKTERRFRNGEQSQNNWKPFQNHKRNHRSQNFSSDVDNVQYNNSDAFHGKNIHPKDPSDYTAHHDTMNGYSGFYRQISNGNGNSRYFRENTAQEISNEQMSNESGNYRLSESSSRTNQENFDLSKSNRSRKSKYNSSASQVNFLDTKSNSNGKYNSSERRSRYYNDESVQENYNASKFSRSGKYKNSSERNFENHNEEVQLNSDVPKFNRNGKYKNSNEKDYRSFNEDIPQDNSDVFRNNGNANRRNNGRISQFYQKRPKYNGKDSRSSHSKKMDKQAEIASQRERLEDMLKRRTLECLVCCESLKHNDKVWSCRQCYHILHLRCTQAWAKSSKIDNGWRCPACQNVCKEIPEEYFCFCGKLKNPRNEPGLIAHSCGEICYRERRNCEHRCLILCHPGPCPDCNILADKSCGCGKTKQQVMCSSDVEILCENRCGKSLDCGIHECDKKCHMGECKPCEEVLQQHCFCNKKNRVVICSVEFNGSNKYSCEDTCEKTLSCGNHKCQEICHNGACKLCTLDCALIKTCFCGKKPLKVPRTSCLDPIPSCGLVCKKILKCGPNNARHKCESVCHDGKCPPCDLTTVLKCRCGLMDKEIPCQKMIDDDARCERKCTKKRLCGKHKCNQRCCIEIEHICPLPCNRTLSCGNHRCELTCHSGRCKPCMETSFEELFCECGSKVMYPPIPCGTKPPTCDKPCSRPRGCGHEVNHTCHTGPCPPCTVLCKKWCYGNHEQRKTIPCHQDDFSCGLPCGKQMPCGRHKCISSCHLGVCPVPCKQPCLLERSSCGHPCNAPCHEPPCPHTNCKSKVAVSCSCGIQKGVRSCNEVINEIRNMELALVSEKMSKNQSVDISDMKFKRPDVLKILECTEECRVLERNRRLAIGLQIRNPDISQKLSPRYSDFMRGWAKKDPRFCQKVHNKLTELVQLAKQSQQKSRSYSFESMNRDKRQFVHEYCEHFGCESAAYDSEPNRNIVATATRDKSWLPSMALLEVIQRENGQRKVPMPSHLERNLYSKSESVTLKPLSKTLRLGVQVNDVEYGKK